MPLVEVKLIEGVFTEEQKNRMIEKLTDAMVSIEGENLREVTWVTIEEVTKWGLGHRWKAYDRRGSQRHSRHPRPLHDERTRARGKFSGPLSRLARFAAASKIFTRRLP